MRHLLLRSAFCGAIILPAQAALGAGQPRGRLIVPESSVLRAADAGVRAHTMVQLLVPAGRTMPGDTTPSGNFETPASLACVYRLVAGPHSCNPQMVTSVAQGGSQVIAIVDAYDDPHAAEDLAHFSAQFGLPAITRDNFQTVYADGHKPKVDPTGGWELEESLDIEMAHALAPNAKILLVEAPSNSFTALPHAASIAAKLVSASGGGEVSNSWGSGEFFGEGRYRRDFSQPKVVSFAASGDYFVVEFPSVLGNVVAAGGSTIARDDNGDYLDQSTWLTPQTLPYPTGTGGGQSLQIRRPAFQDGIASLIGANRSTPDLSFDANPYTGVWVYDSYPYGGTKLHWVVVGGTSVASPALAAMANAAGHFRASSADELGEIYKLMGERADFTDIRRGSCPAEDLYEKYMKGWDFCTGVGVPHGLGGL